MGESTVLTHVWLSCFLSICFYPIGASNIGRSGPRTYFSFSPPPPPRRPTFFFANHSLPMAPNAGKVRKEISQQHTNHMWGRSAKLCVKLSVHLFTWSLFGCITILKTKTFYLNLFIYLITSPYVLISETVLRVYCEAIGIDYQDYMVNWRPLTPEQFAQFEEWTPWVGTVLESTGFLKSTPRPIKDLSTLPEDVQKCMNNAMRPYNNLHAKRLLPK